MRFLLGFFFALLVLLAPRLARADRVVVLPFVSVGSTTTSAKLEPPPGCEVRRFIEIQGEARILVEDEGAAAQTRFLGEPRQRCSPEVEREIAGRAQIEGVGALAPLRRSGDDQLPGNVGVTQQPAQGGLVDER